MEHLAKPELKREVKISTAPLPNMENANFTVYSHDTTSEKMILAYDIAGNAIECSIEEILNNKYRPKPDFGITEEPKAKCFRVKPEDLTADMMK
jgi:hypothetical protein